jgi:hypothetical protein
VTVHADQPAGAPAAPEIVAPGCRGGNSGLVALRQAESFEAIKRAYG